MQELITNLTVTISSVELVKYINEQRDKGSAELQHSDFMKKVAKVIGELGAGNFSGTYKDIQNKDRPCYNLPKREACLMVMSESYKVQAAVYDRLQELESKHLKPMLPQTYAEALRALADESEAKQLALAQIETDKPKVEFAMQVRNLQGSCSISDFAKTIGTGRNKFYEQLRTDKYLMHNNRPYQQYLNEPRDLFVVVEGIPYTDGNGKTFPAFETRITGKGQVFLEKKYRDIA